MGLVEKTKSAMRLIGRVMNEVVSFIVFSCLDIVDFILCYTYKTIDFIIEAEWKPCYCSSAKEAITSSGKILVSEQGESKKIVRLTSSGSTKLQLEEISDTLYTRPSLLSDLSKSTLNELKRLKQEQDHQSSSSSCNSNNCNCDHHHGHDHHDHERRRRIINKKNKGARSSTFTVNSTIVEMLQGKIGGQKSHPIPRWSDCDCTTCTSWSSSNYSKETLFVRAQGPLSLPLPLPLPPKEEEEEEEEEEEDVIFIHGFISSSAFWTETLFPNFSERAKSRYRLLAIDLLGFGRSPKPTDSLYTLREHVDMIERSVLDSYKVKSFHIVAHSLGCILALALAVKHPSSVKSLTLLAPPYFPATKGEQATQYMMRRVAPRRVWPVIAFGASIACWYEHISRTICLLICKNHRLWEFLTKLLTRNRIRTYLMEGFFCHTHNAAWHTLHNIICGTAGKIDGYLDAVRYRLKCEVTIFHGRDDELIPVECSYNVKSRIPRARVKVIENKDHITIVVGRQKAFARELEEIWKNTS